jgi:hypothetical protein
VPQAGQNASSRRFLVAHFPTIEWKCKTRQIKKALRLAVPRHQSASWTAPAPDVAPAGSVHSHQPFHRKGQVSAPRIRRQRKGRVSDTGKAVSTFAPSTKMERCRRWRDRGSAALSCMSMRCGAAGLRVGAADHARSPEICVSIRRRFVSGPGKPIVLVASGWPGSRKGRHPLGRLA